MSTLQAEFEFEIGDFVFFKSELLGSQRPRAFIVEGRRIEQCHGGIQTQYALSEDKSWVTSIALAKVDEAFHARHRSIWGADMEKRIKEAVK